MKSFFKISIHARKRARVTTKWKVWENHPFKTIYCGIDWFEECSLLHCRSDFSPNFCPMPSKSNGKPTACVNMYMSKLNIMKLFCVFKRSSREKISNHSCRICTTYIFTHSKFCVLLFDSTHSRGFVWIEVVNPELRQSFVLSKRTTPPKRKIWGWHGSDAEGLMGIHFCSQHSWFNWGILLEGFRSGGGDYGDVSVKHGRVYGK